jgi:hypothetical protein
LKTDFGGLPIAFHLTGGEASDSRNFETLLDIGPDIDPRAALGDTAKCPITICWPTQVRDIPSISH